MRSKLLAGAAGCALFVAFPTVSFVGPDDEAQRGVSPLDPLSASLSICRTTSAEGPTRRGLFISAAKAYAQAAADPAGPPALLEGVASSALEATVNESARPYFEQGVGLVDGFNHFEAVRAFRAGGGPGLRALLLGRSLCARPEHQRPDGSGQ